MVVLSTTSCIKRDDMENINIYTTIYPINYIIERFGIDVTIPSYEDTYTIDGRNGFLSIDNQSLIS